MVDQAALPNRRSIRLRGYDYSRNGAYFVTICTTQRLCLFGEIAAGAMQLSPVGEAVDAAWRDLPVYRPSLILDAWVVMPNHLHGIVILPGFAADTPHNTTSPHGPMPHSLGAVVGGFKSAVSREISAKELTLVRPIWQRNYFERIIRNDRELEAARRYIEANPARWTDDPNHLNRL